MRNLAHITALAVALALSAGAGMAIGSTRPDDRATHGQGAIVLEQRTDVVRPDDRARHGQGAIVLEQRTTSCVPTTAQARTGRDRARAANDVVRPDDRATHGQGAIEFEQVARADRDPVIAARRISVSAGRPIRLARRRDRRGCRARSRTDRRWERRRTPPRSRTGVLVAASARPRAHQSRGPAEKGSLFMASNRWAAPAGGPSGISPLGARPHADWGRCSCL